MRHMTGIPDMKYPKRELLEKLTKNRAEHVEKFKSAQKEYLKATASACKKLLDKVESGKEVNHLQELAKLAKPENYTRQYDRIIQMLTFTSDEQIELSQEVFTQIVLDEWEWSDHFAATRVSNSSYL
jgi:hypothetical protein